MTLIDNRATSDDAPEVVTVDDTGAAGDYITDQDGVRYWLTADQLDDYDAADSDIEDDDDFNDWFREFRHAHGIKPAKRRRSRGWRDLWTPPETKPKYLSEWSLSPVYKASSSGSTAIYLAEMLGGVQSIVRALEPTGVRYRVVLSDDMPEAPNSYTSYTERLVSVSPQPLLDTTLERGAAIDITSGEGLHEVGHVRESEEVYRSIINHPDGPPKPWAIGSYLLNLLEDLKIERNIAREYPGFAGYFTAMNAYLWKLQEGRGVAPTSWGPKLASKMNAIVLSVKWPTEYEPIATAKPRSNLAREFVWWRDWGQRYLLGSDVRDLIIEGLDRLKLDPDTRDELDKMTSREAELDSMEPRESAYHAFEEFKRRVKTPIADPCPTPGRSEGKPGVTRDPAEKISGTLKEEVERLLDEEMMIDKPWITHANGKYGVPEIVVLKPKRGYTKVAPLNRGLLNRMRDAFKFRHVDNDEVSRMLRSGRVDPTQLHRWKNNDWRIFDRRIVKSKPNTHVTLLIDQSGSMGSAKLSQAVDAAQLVHGCLRDMPGVTLRVRSHTADCTDVGTGNVAIYRIWEKGEPMDQLSSIYKLPHTNNGDGYAIEWCAKELINTTRPTEQRLLIVFSDGQPAFSGYPYYGAETHVREVVKWAEAHGVIVVQIAIDSALTASSQAQMFTNWIPFEGTDRLPTQIMGLLKRVM